MQERNDIMSVDAMMDERYGKVGTPGHANVATVIGVGASYAFADNGRIREEKR